MDRRTQVLAITIILGVLALSGTESKAAEKSAKPRRSGESSSETRYKWSNGDDLTGDGSRRTRAKCVDIPQTMSLCRGIGYLKMRLPNLLEHETLAEVQHEAASWAPLLSTRCSADTQLFLCSLFSPVCLDQPIWPCRSLCLAVKRGCETRMASHGYPWPEMLNCDKLPSDTDLCIAIQSNQSSVQDSGDQYACRICQNITSNTNVVVANFCQAGFVARIKPEMAVISGNDLKIMPSKKVKFYKSPNIQIPKRRPTFYIEGGAKCDCFDLSSTAQYIVMGNVADKHRLTLTSVVKFDAKSKAGRQALKAMKKPDRCPAVVINGSGRPSVVDKKEKRSKGQKQNGKGQKASQKDINKRGSRKIQKGKRKKNSGKNRNSEELEIVT